MLRLQRNIKCSKKGEEWSLTNQRKEHLAQRRMNVKEECPLNVVAGKLAKMDFVKPAVNQEQWQEVPNAKVRR